MGTQVSPIFDELEAQARRYPTPGNVMTGAWLCYQAKEKAGEIFAMRQERDIQRKNSERKNSTNGTISTLDIHPLEWQAACLLLPELDSHDPTVLTGAIRKMLKTEWGKEFSPSPFEKTRF